MQDNGILLKCEEKKKTKKMQKLDVYYKLLPQHVSSIIMPIFRKKRPRCRMRALLASYNAAPHNRYQPHPAEPEQYIICSNTVFVFLKMGIMMIETC